MIKKIIDKIYYKSHFIHTNFLIILFQMTDGSLYKVDNCNVTKISIFNKNKYTLYESFNKIKTQKNNITAIRIGEEMEFYVKLKSNDFITIFRELNYDTSENFHVLDIYFGDKIDNDFLESFNNSIEIN